MTGHLVASYRDGAIGIPAIKGSWRGATVSVDGRLPLPLFADWLPDWVFRAVRPSGVKDASPPGSTLAPRAVALVAPATLSQVAAVRQARSQSD